MWYYIQCDEFGIIYRNKKGKVENIEEIPSNLPLFILTINSVISKEQRQQFSKELGIGKKGYTIALESTSGFYPCVLVESRMARSRGGSTELTLWNTKMYSDCRNRWLAIVDSNDKALTKSVVSQSCSGNQFSSSTRTEPKWNTTDENIISLAKQALEGDLYWKLL